MVLFWGIVDGGLCNGGGVVVVPYVVNQVLDLFLNECGETFDHEEVVRVSGEEGCDLESYHLEGPDTSVKEQLLLVVSECYL